LSLANYLFLEVKLKKKLPFSVVTKLCPNYAGYVDPKAGDVSNDAFIYDISGVY